jgi:hypothetical protein
VLDTDPVSENDTYCGNPACPTNPPIAERSDLPVELRQPCPACGSLSRRFVRMVQESVLSGSGTLSAGGLAVTATITAEAGVIPAAKLSLHGLPVTHEIVVVYSDLSDQPDPACIIEVQTREGGFLAMGAGLSPADALSNMFERMLPDSSSEAIRDQDEPPLPDDEM